MISSPTNAIKMLRINNTSDGKCLMKGFLILKWKYWAANMNKPMIIAGTAIRVGNQIPAAIKVATEIFAAPTKVLVKSLSPNCLNSLMITSYLKIQT